MAETLIAILLVVDNHSGHHLVFHWPPEPKTRPRLARPRPVKFTAYELDHFWQAAQTSASDPKGDSSRPRKPYVPPPEDDQEYEWQRPNIVIRNRAQSFKGASRSHPSSRRASPSRHNIFDDDRDSSRHMPSSSLDPEEEKFHSILQYPKSFLEGILCPTLAQCHQKFELIVDDLVFIGHPVSVDQDGVWRFKPERPEGQSRMERGRESRNRRRGSFGQDLSTQEGSSTEGTSATETAVETEQIPSSSKSPSRASTMSIFHLVLVIDLPDTSSAISGNLFKYLHIIYEQIAFTVTAVLYQEQVLHGFVEKECEELIAIRENCVKNGETFATYNAQVRRYDEYPARCSIVGFMRTLYTSIKANQIARLTINSVTMELQLPPYLDSLIHPYDEDNVSLYFGSDMHGESPDVVPVSWGNELGFGWKLPSLAPWKSLLVFEGEDDLVTSLKQSGLGPEDKELADGLIQFLQKASPFTSLAEAANILDWNLETQVYPTVRWLVYHRKAKVVDTIHQGLKTVFSLPPAFSKPLTTLSRDFAADFSHPSIPSLPRLLALISSAGSAAASSRSYPSSLDHTHFFATVVGGKRDLIPLYRDVVLWLLKRDLIIKLHLHVRVVVPPELKERVRIEREERLARRAGRRRKKEAKRKRRLAVMATQGYLDGSALDDGGEMLSESTATPSGAYLGGAAPSDRARRRFSSLSSRSILSTAAIPEEPDREGSSHRSDMDDGTSDAADEDPEWDILLASYDYQFPTIIDDPGQATPIQQKWLEAMSEGMDPIIARRFEQINQYFDGKRTDDEILYRAEITRKQLREVLHHYDSFLLTFLHPA